MTDQLLDWVIDYDRKVAVAWMPGDEYRLDNRAGNIYPAADRSSSWIELELLRPMVGDGYRPPMRLESFDYAIAYMERLAVDVLVDGVADSIPAPGVGYGKTLP